MSPEAAVRRAIARAEAILPGIPAPEGKLDRRWQAMMRVADFIGSRPEEVWQFCLRWGKHPQANLRMAVACVLLEDLIEQHFDLIFPRLRPAATESVRFGDTIRSCWCFLPEKEPEKYKRVRRLQRQLSRRRDHRRAATRGAT
jgi:hypothetical protein